MKKLTTDLKELYYLAKVYKHIKAVNQKMIYCANNLLNRAATHDDSRFYEKEMASSVEPIWNLNNGGIEINSEEFILEANKMEEAGDFHFKHNDHHPGFYGDCEDPISEMNLFQIIEMICDLSATSEDAENKTDYAIALLKAQCSVSEQLEKVIRNTLKLIEIK